MDLIDNLDGFFPDIEPEPDDVDDVDVATVVMPPARSAPARPRSRVPLCEGCGQGDVALSCDCCGQELCHDCWGDGSDALCASCLAADWDERRPSEEPEPEIPVGLSLPTAAAGGWTPTGAEALEWAQAVGG